jgi:hypothetical protein
VNDYVPLSELPVITWRGCDGCNGTLLLDEEQALYAESLDDAGAYLLCRTCQRRADAEEKARPVVPRARCLHRYYQRGPFSELVITKVEGDQVTVAVLGMGGTDDARQDEILARWWPTSMQGRRCFYRYDLLMKGM